MSKLACAEDKTRVLSQFLVGCFRMKSWHLTRDQKGDKKPDKGSSRERPEEGVRGGGGSEGWSQRGSRQRTVQLVLNLYSPTGVRCLDSVWDYF